MGSRPLARTTPILLLPEVRRRKIEQLGLFDLSGITDDAFWEQAEARVIATLHDYAGKARNGMAYQRHLFADDATAGFGFIDLFRARFDIVLMNPPFGEPSREAKHYVDRTFPTSRVDLYATFVERCGEVLASAGFLGAISSRTGFFLSSLETWRKRFLLSSLSPTVVADLGPRVLDAASVETAAYCLSRRDAESRSAALFFDLVSKADKSDTLTAMVADLSQGNYSGSVYLADPRSFQELPGSPISYWMSPEARAIFAALPPLESGKRLVRTTIGTANDARWIRAWWEVPPISPEASFRWVPHCKGGQYSPYCCDLRLVLAWDDTRQSYPGYMGTFHRLI